MGIQYLNSFLRKNCSNNITLLSLSALRNKTIVIDTSIYLYRYEMEGALIENFYYMISLLLHHKIVPIFIFDGKAREIKKAKLMERAQEKRKAEQKYNNICKIFEEEKDCGRREELKGEMDKIRKKFVKISKNDIDKVKELMSAYGVPYYTAPYEADELCVKLVLNKQAYGCMSEDMDMFVYGCPIVFRYVSLLKETVVQYNLRGILKTLNMSLLEFREICVISGTDYNKSSYNLYYYYKKFLKFKRSNDCNFYEWLSKHTNSINDIFSLLNIYFMFDLNSEEYAYLREFEDCQYNMNKKNSFKLQSILRKDGFIFLDS